MLILHHRDEVVPWILAVIDDLFDPLFDSDSGKNVLFQEQDITHIALAVRHAGTSAHSKQVPGAVIHLPG